jgi:hypothetical protein
MSDGSRLKYEMFYLNEFVDKNLTHNNVPRAQAVSYFTSRANSNGSSTVRHICLVAGQLNAF